MRSILDTDDAAYSDALLGSDPVLEFADVLRDRWPYQTEHVADAVVHEELVRIESAWARAIACSGLDAACRRRDAGALATVWETAAHAQLFPFPTAVMLVGAAEEAPCSLDSRCWRLLRELNTLCDGRAVAHHRRGTDGPDAREAQESAKALLAQRDAIEGAGYGRTERRRRRRLFAAPMKLREDDVSEGATERKYALRTLSGRWATRRRRRRRRSSLLDATMGESDPASAASDGKGSASADANHAAAAADGPSGAARAISISKTRLPSALRRRSARRHATRSPDVHKDAPPSSRRLLRMVGGAARGGSKAHTTAPAEDECAAPSQASDVRLPAPQRLPPVGVLLANERLPPATELAVEAPNESAPAALVEFAPAALAESAAPAALVLEAEDDSSMSPSAAAASPSSPSSLVPPPAMFADRARNSMRMRAQAAARAKARACRPPMPVREDDEAERAPSADDEAAAPAAADEVEVGAACSPRLDEVTVTATPVRSVSASRGGQMSARVSGAPGTLQPSARHHAYLGTPTPSQSRRTGKQSKNVAFV